MTAKMYQHLITTNDINGNPRRLYVLLDKQGTMTEVIDEGYSGLPDKCRDLIRLPDVITTPKEYRVFKNWLR